MVALSQELAAYRAPLRGMDVRRLAEAGSPEILYNIDVSHEGVWRSRPGFRIRGVKTNSRTMGLHVARFNDRPYVFQITADLAGTMTLTVYSTVPDPTSKLFKVLYFEVLTAEPHTEKYYYSFLQVGRFVYFSNGYGVMHEVEWGGQPHLFTVKSDFLETGIAPDVQSYILGQLSPTSFHLYYDQVFTGGYLKDNPTRLSNPLDPDQTEVPAQLLTNTRSYITVSKSHLFVSEFALWKSYPVEDFGGMYWLFQNEVVAVSSIGDIVIVFTKDSIYRIMGHGTPGPKREWVADLSLVSPRAVVDVGPFLFFVAQDGCHMTDGRSVTKVSHEMDPLWFSQYKPSTTRTVQNRLRKTVYPFFVNRRRLRFACCVNDRNRKQVMVSLTSSGFYENNMFWVWNYEDLINQTGTWKWSIWSGKEEPLWQTDIVENPMVGGRNNTPLAGSPSTICQATAMAVDRDPAGDTVYYGTADGKIFSVDGVGDSIGFHATGKYPITGGYPILIGLGRAGEVNPDGRTVYTDVAIRHLQSMRNQDDDSSQADTQVVIRSEGVAQHLIDANDEDVEGAQSSPNMQFGTSEVTNSVMGNAANPSMQLGDKPVGTASPLMGAEYTDSYSRINAPDGEARTITVDIFRSTEARQPNLNISEVRIYGLPKDGSQRNQT